MAEKTAEQRADNFIGYHMLKNWNCRNDLIQRFCAVKQAARQEALEECKAIADQFGVMDARWTADEISAKIAALIAKEPQ